MQSLAARTIENPLFKDRVTFLETTAETEGKRTTLLLEVAPKGGNSLHYHKTFDEVFTVHEGQLGIQLGKDIFVLEAGERVRVKAGDLHRFFNPSATQTVVVHVLLDPGHRGMEIGLQVAYGLASEGRTTRQGIPKNRYHMALLMHWTDTHIPGVFSLLEPLLRWWRKRAIQKGMDQALVRQYVKF